MDAHIHVVGDDSVESSYFIEETYRGGCQVDLLLNLQVSSHCLNVNKVGFCITACLFVFCRSGEECCYMHPVFVI